MIQNNKAHCSSEMIKLEEGEGHCEGNSIVRQNLNEVHVMKIE